MLVEEAALDERDFHRLEIACTGHALVGLDRAWPGSRRITLNRDAAPTDAAAERQDRDRARRFDAGQVPCALQQLLVKEPAALVRIRRAGHRQTQRDHVARHKARIDLLRVYE